MAQAQSYTVMDCGDLRKIIDQIGVKEEQIIKYNLASLYLLNDDRAALQPNSGYEGILFLSVDDFKEMEEEGYYPVKGFGTIFERERERLVEIENNKDYYISFLLEKLGIEIKTDSSINFLELNNSLKKYGKKKIDNELYIPLGIFIGEKIRIKVNGDWVLEKKYAMNPYWVPWIQDGESNKYNIWYSLEKAFESKKQLNVEEIINDIQASKDDFKDMILNYDNLYNAPPPNSTFPFPSSFKGTELE